MAAERQTSSVYAFELLKDDDTVGVIYPCRATPGFRDEYRQLIEAFGFTALLPEEEMTNPLGYAYEPHYQYSGDPVLRAWQIVKMLYNDEVKALWSANGGTGAAEVVAQLVAFDRKPMHFIETNGLDASDRLREDIESNLKQNRRGLPKRGIPLVGYSNNGQLQVYLGQMGIVTPFYGSTLHAGGPLQLERLEYLEEVAAALKGKGHAVFEGVKCINREEETIKGVLYATSASEFALKRPWQLNCGSNTILAIEDTGLTETPEELISSTQALAKLLCDAKEAKALDNVSAILIGSCGWDYQMPDADTLLSKFVDDIPIYFMNNKDHAFGHYAGRKTMMCYSTAILEGGKLEIGERRTGAELDGCYRNGPLYPMERSPVDVTVEPENAGSLQISIKAVNKAAKEGQHNEPLTIIEKTLSDSGLPTNVDGHNGAIFMRVHYFIPQAGEQLVAACNTGCFTGAQALVVQLKEPPEQEKRSNLEYIIMGNMAGTGNVAREDRIVTCCSYTNCEVGAEKVRQYIEDRLGNLGEITIDKPIQENQKTTFTISLNENVTDKMIEERSTELGMQDQEMRKDYIESFMNYVARYNFPDIPVYLVEGPPIEIASPNRVIIGDGRLTEVPQEGHISALEEERAHQDGREQGGPV